MCEKTWQNFEVTSVNKCWGLVVQLPLPRTIVSLAKADVEEPKFSSPDPVLHVTDKVTSKRIHILTPVDDLDYRKGQCNSCYVYESFLSFLKRYVEDYDWVQFQEF